MPVTDTRLVMTMPPFHRILATTALCLAAVGLNSCLCSDLPIVVNAIGREEARTYGKYQSPHEVEIYRLGDNYYVKCDLKFIPQESGLFTWHDMYAPVSSLFAFNKCTPELIEATPAETYMVLMNQHGLKLLLQIDADAPPESVPRMIPVGQFDFTHAVRCKPNPDPDWADGLWTGGLVNIIYSTDRCSTLHYALRPLYWASWAVEIPFVVVCNTAIYAVAIPASVIGEVTQQQHESPTIYEVN